jgi:hypothetical protein
MFRLNFYKLNTKKDFKDFIKSILTSSTDVEKGYIQTLEQKEDSLHAIFYLKVLVEEKISDPFGGTENITYYSYQKIEFFIYKSEKYLLLVIKDQPKSLKKFIDYLKNNDSLFFSINNFNIKMENLFEKIIFKIIKAKFNDVELSNNAFANIEVNSSANALNDFNLLQLKGSKKLTKLKIIEDFDDIYFECEFNEKASFLLKIDYVNLKLIRHIFDKYIS